MPVLPKGELEVLLEAAIDLSKKGINTLNLFSLVCTVDNNSFDQFYHVWLWDLRA